MKAIDNYKGGKLKSGDPLLEMLVKEFKGGKDPSYTLAQLARALQGKIQIEGIDKNLKRGNRIVKLLGNNYKGPLGNGFLHWAKLEMGKHFDDPNATYKSLTNTIKNSMKEAGITGDLAIDEIFPARTGQLTLGKGESFDHEYKENKIYVDSFTGKVYQYNGGGTFTEVELTEEDIKS